MTSEHPILWESDSSGIGTRKPLKSTVPIYQVAVAPTNESMPGVSSGAHPSTFKGLNDGFRAQEMPFVIGEFREKNLELHKYRQLNGKQSNDAKKIDILSPEMSRLLLRRAESKGSSCPRNLSERIVGKSLSHGRRNKKHDQHHESDRRVPREVSKDEGEA